MRRRPALSMIQSAMRVKTKLVAGLALLGERGRGGDELGQGDHQSNKDRVLESDALEKSWRVVEKGVEACKLPSTGISKYRRNERTRQLLDPLQSASDHQPPKVRSNEMKLLPRRDKVPVGSHVLPDARADDGSLHLDLGRSGVGVHLGEDLDRRCQLVVPKEVSRGFGEDAEEAKLKNLGELMSGGTGEELEKPTGGAAPIATITRQPSRVSLKICRGKRTSGTLGGSGRERNGARDRRCKPGPAQK